MLKNVRMGYLSGGFLLATGLFFTTGALQLEVGTARSMGPGFFPLCLGGMLIIFSLLTVVADWRETFTLAAPSRVLAFISVSVVVFATVVGPFGFIPSVALAVFIASIADDEWHWSASTLLAIGASVSLWVIFSKLLGLPIAGLKVLGSWIF